VKTCRLLALHTSNEVGADAFLRSSCHAVDMLKCLAKDCAPADRLLTVERANRALKAIYRNGTKPPAPPPINTVVEEHFNAWNASAKAPRLRSAILDGDCLTISFHGATRADGDPPGAFVYARWPLPADCEVAYFEVQVIVEGEKEEEDDAHSFSVGLAPLPIPSVQQQRRADQSAPEWRMPEGN